MNATTGLILLAAILFVASGVLALQGQGDAAVVSMIATAAPIVKVLIDKATRERVLTTQNDVLAETTVKLTRELTEAERLKQEALETTTTLLTEKDAAEIRVARLEAKLKARNTGTT